MITTIIILIIIIIIMFIRISRCTWRHACGRVGPNPGASEAAQRVPVRLDATDIIMTIYNDKYMCIYIYIERERYTHT